MAIEDTLKHVLFLARLLKNCSPQCVVVSILMELNIPTKNAGFEYLKRAILLFHENPTLMITKDIYQKIGESCAEAVSIAQVEQSIRQVISAAWKNKDQSAFIRYFSCGANGIVKKPTNAEFISRIARILELWEGCCEKEADYER